MPVIKGFILYLIGPDSVQKIKIKGPPLGQKENKE